MTLGSLFDGSGGFPLAGSLCGVEPVWAAEVEPYPIAVTRSRFPKMLHYGDVSKINGAEVPPVDIITFGSPCQDLSIAGKRAGMKHTENGDEETTRSGLFMEAIRIIKEMRSATNGQYPRYAVWENVPGAFSSNKGEDFRIVLEEFVKVIEPTAEMPSAPKSGWPYADAYVGDGWSLAYRTFDAQYWGVPQRRRRIYLVADFVGGRAPVILFEREGVRGYFETFRTEGEATSAHAEGSVGADDYETHGGCRNACDGLHGGVNDAVPYTLKIRSGCAVDANGKSGGKGALIQEDKSGTLSTMQDQYLFQPVVEGLDGYNSALTGDKAATLGINCGMSTGRNGVVIQEPIAVATQQGGAEITTNGVCPTVTAAAGMSGNNQPWICKPIVEAEGFDMYNQQSTGEVSRTLKTPVGGDDLPVVCVKTWDARGNGDGAVVGTITGDHENRVADYTNLITEPIPIHDKATRYKGGGPTRNGDGAGNGLGVGEAGAPAYTVTTGDHHAVAYAESTYAMTTGSFMQVAEEVAPTLMARDYKDPTCVCIRYIVRRLTPAECARLQGFADRWGDIDQKEDFTEEEYAFWLNVRNLHAEINGKAVKDYTKEQMLTWYNKLHSDSAEYKMWGNGIALPPSLYVLQGITTKDDAE